MLRFTVISVLSLFSLNAYSTDASIIQDRFNETITENVPVSGRVLMGIALFSSSSLDFSFRVPQKAKGNNLCFRVVSQDGTYVSENEYIINNVPDSGFSSAVYPSAYSDKLVALGASELSLLATPGACASNVSGKYYLSARGDTNAPDQQATLFVSSGQSDVYLRIPTQQGKKETFNCSKIEQGATTAYDTLCSVSISKLTKGINQLSLLRRKSGRFLPPFSFDVILER